MPTEEVTSEVALLVELIEQMCLARETVLGTDLGGGIRLRFPDLSMKVRFGSLRRFIQDHCAGRVVYVRAQGGDGVYAHVSKVGTQGPLESRPASAPTAWAAVVDPNVHSQVAVDTVQGSLHVYPAGTECPDKLIPVEKVSLEEHRTIAKEFLPLIPIASRSSFESALSEHTFWPRWTAAFRTLADRQLFTNWMKWRYEKIVAIFKERLRSAGIPEEAAVSAISEFQKSRQVKQAPTKSTSVSMTTRSRVSAGDPSDFRLGPPDSLLRELAHLVINSMSDQAIRRIRVPLGAVTDVLQRRK